MRKFLLSRGLRPLSIDRNDEFSSSVSVNDPEGHRISFIAGPGIVEPSIKDIQNSQGNLAGREMIDARIIHAGFVVRKGSAMEHFYKDILGFKPYWHGGMKEDQSDWLDLQVPDGTDWIEFMLNVPADADKKLLGVMNHIALGVPDIHAAAKQLLTNGMKLTEEPQIGRDGKWQLNLYDPDDTRVELMEFTPVEKPCCSNYTGPHPKP
jgi:catechol 2,3-dioxygenase-like lactoylglutathione lyase family enzyme